MKPFNIVLFAPEIPQNTGTIGRLAVSLLSRTAVSTKPVRLIGVGISQLTPIGELSLIQLQLPLDDK